MSPTRQLKAQYQPCHPAYCASTACVWGHRHQCHVPVLKQMPYGISESGGDGYGTACHVSISSDSVGMPQASTLQLTEQGALALGRAPDCTLPWMVHVNILDCANIPAHMIAKNKYGHCYTPGSPYSGGTALHATVVRFAFVFVCIASTMKTLWSVNRAQVVLASNASGPYRHPPCWHLHLDRTCQHYYVLLHLTAVTSPIATPLFLLEEPPTLFQT